MQRWNIAEGFWFIEKNVKIFCKDVYEVYLRIFEMYVQIICKFVLVNIYINKLKVWFYR